jgi:hypothetical protein
MLAGIAYCRPENRQPYGARRRTGICGVAAPRRGPASPASRRLASAHPALAPECELISARPLRIWDRPTRFPIWRWPEMLRALLFDKSREQGKLIILKLPTAEELAKHLQSMSQPILIHSGETPALPAGVLIFDFHFQLHSNFLKPFDIQLLA